MDSDWVDIQHKAFTGWVNYYLRERSLVVENLKDDLQDGVHFVNLVEILTKKPIPKWVKSPKSVMHKITNNSLALKALQESGVMSSGCSAEDITNGNLKMMLGLMWTLILHFQIGEEGEKKEGARERVMKWMKAHLSGYSIDLTSFPKSLLDGNAFCYLIHKREPSLINLTQMETKTPLERLTSAFEIAERNLGIPQLLDPEDVIHEKIDEKSILTYLSYFKAHLNRPILVDTKLQSEMEELRKQLEEESSNFKGTKQELSKVQEELQKMKHDSHSKKLSGLEEEMQQLKLQGAKAAETTEQYAELKAKYKLTAKALKELKSQHEETEFELEEVWRKLKEEKRLKAAAEEMYKLTLEEAEALRVKTRTDQSRVITMQTQLDLLNEEMKTTKEKLANSKEKRKDMKFDYEKKIRELEKQSMNALTSPRQMQQASEQEIQSLRAKVEELTKQTEQLSEQIGDMEADRERLKKKIASSEQEREETLKTFISLRAAAERHASETEELKKKIQEKKKKHKTAGEDKKKLEEEMESLQRKMKMQERAMAEFEETKKQYEDSIEELRAKIKASNMEKSVLSEQVETLNFEISKMKPKIAEVEALKKKVKEEKDKRKKVEDECENDLDQMRQKLLNYDRNIDSGRSNLESEFEERRKKLDDEIKELKEKLEQRDKQQEAMEKSVEDLKGSVHNKTLEVQSWENKEGEWNQEKSQMSQEIQELKQQLESNRASQQQVDIMEEECSKLKAQVEESKEKNEYLREERKRVEEELNTLKIATVSKDVAVQLEEEAKVLKLGIEKKAGEITEIQAEFERKEKKLKEENEKLQSQVAKLIESAEMDKLQKKYESLKQDSESLAEFKEKLEKENQQLEEQLKKEKATHEEEIRKIKEEISAHNKETMVTGPKLSEMASTASPSVQRNAQSERIKILLEDCIHEFLELRNKLEGTIDYNEAIKISKKIRDAKRQLEAAVSDLSGASEQEVTTVLKGNPRKQNPPLKSMSKDAFPNKETYQKVKKLKEVVAYAIEKSLDDLHYVILKLEKLGDNKDKLVLLAQVAKMLIQVFAASEEKTQREEETEYNKLLKTVDTEMGKVQEVLKMIRNVLDNSSMEKAVEVARIIRAVKKDLQDFFTANNISMPAENQPTASSGEDKFTALKKMMMSTLDRMNVQASILGKQASKCGNMEKAAEYKSKLEYMEKQFSTILESHS